jgi:hypothetical protein
LLYFGRQTPSQWLFELPRLELRPGMTFAVEVLDTWNMTVTPVEGTFKIIADTTYRYHAEGQKKVKLPGHPWMALRIKRVGDAAVKSADEPRIYGEG